MKGVLEATPPPPEGNDTSMRVRRSRATTINPQPLPRRTSTAAYNLRVLWPLARWIEDHHGADALTSITGAVGLSASDFDGRNRWIPAPAFEAVLTAARALVRSDDEFKAACAHRMREAYGPLRYLLWATSPAVVLEKAIKNLRLMTTVGDADLTRVGRTSARVRFRGSFSRLTCLVRQAQSEALPTIWGMPPAHIRVLTCVGQGDPFCEWQVEWYETRRWLPAVAGAVAGAGAGWMLHRVGLGGAPTSVFVPLFGALLGHFVESRRAERLNAATQAQVTEALRLIATEEAEARREMTALNERQKDWTRLVEEQMVERTRALEHVVDGMQCLQQERVSKVLGFSHDLRNPLQVLQFGVEALRARGPHDDYVTGIVDDLEYALRQMKRILTELVTTASAQRGAPMQSSVDRIDVRAFVASLQRRLRALVFGRDVCATASMTTQAPGAIEIDQLMLDRIVDNLLTNAAKYTDHGTITVELDGAPGSLVLKVSDTGCGIEPSALDRIFEPGGSSLETRRGDSFGVGLSVVVQLLDQLGGRLEVMSKPGAGTTFWVHLPLESSAPRFRSGPVSSSVPLSRVVRIRSLTA